MNVSVLPNAVAASQLQLSRTCTVLQGTPTSTTYCINLLRSYHREYGTNGSCHTRQKFTVEYITSHQTLKKCHFYSLDIIFFSMQGHKQAVHLLVYE